MYPNQEEDKMRLAAPLGVSNNQQNPSYVAPQPMPVNQEKGMGGQMMDMAKQRAMTGALDAGQAGITSALTGSSAAPVVASGVEGGAILGAGTGAGAGAGMAALGTAMPYVGAGLLAGKALGLFNEGGQVGPLNMQYYKNIYNKYFPTKDMTDMGEPPAFDGNVVIPNIQPDTGVPTGRAMQQYDRDLQKQMLEDIRKNTPLSPQYNAEGTVQKEMLPPQGYLTLGDANEDMMPPNVWQGSTVTPAIDGGMPVQPMLMPMPRPRQIDMDIETLRNEYIKSLGE